MNCTGRGDASADHCCYVDGNVCDYLIENHDGRRFACGLRSELGSWDKVHSDERYQPIKQLFTAAGVALCGEWQPRAGQCCNEVR